MNKSSSVLSEDDRNVSSFFNDSIESVAKCCDFRTKYEECYREMSQTRIETRNLRQENTILRNSLRGTEEENSLLKGILASKKEIIVKLNREAVTSSQEISRLEDQLHVLTQQNQQQRAASKQIEDESNMAKENCRVLREETKNLMERCERMTEQNLKLQRDLQKLKQESIIAEQKFSKELKIVRQQKETALAQTHQTFLKKIEELSISSSPAKISKHAPNLGTKQFTISTSNNNKDLDTTLASFKQRQQQQQVKYADLLRTKDTKIDQLTQKLSDLQAQMAQSMELFEQQISQSHQLKIALSQQQQMVESNEVNKNKQSQREQLLLSAGKRIAVMLKATLIDHGDLVDRLLSALPQGKKFELEVLLKEAEASCQLACKNILANSISMKQYQQINRALGDLRQDYELLQLKHATLQREYGDILEDNRRLIKYNGLSRYRLARNTTSQAASISHPTPSRSKQHRYLMDNQDYSNKENMGSTINT